MVELLRSVCPTIVATQSTNSRALAADTLSALTGGPAEPDPVALESAPWPWPGRRERWSFAVRCIFSMI